MARRLVQRQRCHSMTDIGMAHGLGSESEFHCVQPCKHHPIAPQYPNGNTSKHLQDFSDFVKTVVEGVSRVTFPRPEQRYSSVHVLMISWADDDLGTGKEIRELQTIFEDGYRFSTTDFRIPSNDAPEFDLEDVLTSTKSQHGRSEDELLIIYYGGHSEIDKRTQHSIWKAWRFQPLGASATTSPWVDWSELQSMVMNAKGDILFILDCCYASGDVQDFPRKHKGQRHFLLASGNEKASNQNTLTKALIYELKALGTRPCTVFTVHTKLLRNRSIQQWISTPIFTGVVQGDTGILLAALQDPVAAISSDTRQTISLEEDQLQLFSPCRVLVSVTLTKFGEQSSRDAWVAWFRDHAPPNILAVNFLDVVTSVATFKSDSYFHIISLPVSVWDAMTPNDAIRFLSIVFSDNLWDQDRAELDGQPIAAAEHALNEDDSRKKTNRNARAAFFRRIKGKLAQSETRPISSRFTNPSLD